jgi:hypothetical protein
MKTVLRLSRSTRDILKQLFCAPETVTNTGT